MNFWNTLTELLELKKMTGAEICAVAGLNKSAFTNWKNGTIPRADDALKIAQYLGVSVDYLLTGQTLDNELTAQEQEIIKNFRVLTNDKDIELVTMLLRELVKRY